MCDCFRKPPGQSTISKVLFFKQQSPKNKFCIIRSFDRMNHKKYISNKSAMSSKNRFLYLKPGIKIIALLFYLIANVTLSSYNISKRCKDMQINRLFKMVYLLLSKENVTAGEMAKNVRTISLIWHAVVYLCVICLSVDWRNTHGKVRL